MNAAPRLIGYACMAASLALALAARRGVIDGFGPVPVIVPVLVLGGFGVLLVLTHMMVRALYRQIDAARAAAGDGQGPHAADAPGAGPDNGASPT